MRIFVEPFLLDIEESVELAKLFDIGLELYTDIKVYMDQFMIYHPALLTKTFGESL